MTFSYPIPPDPIALSSSALPQRQQSGIPKQHSSKLPISTRHYSLLRSLQQRYISSTNSPPKPPNNRREFAIDLQSLIIQISDRNRSISPPDLAAIESLKKDFAPELATLPVRVADEIALRSPPSGTSRFARLQRAFHQAASALRNRETRKKSADRFPNSQIDMWGQSCGSNCGSRNRNSTSSTPAPIANPQPETTTFPIGTKLEGEVLLTGFAVGGTPIPDDDNNDRRFNAGYRARLNINTSFTGFDRLRIRFQKSDLPAVNRVTGSDMSRLSYQGNTRGQIVLNRLEYRFSIDNKTEIFTTAKGGNLSHFGDALNPHLDSGSEGTISRFGVRNPIYRQGRGAGFGITHKLGSSVTLGLGYLADDIDRLETGLFGGAYGAIAQITYKPSSQFGIGVNYIKSFNRLDTNTGSDRANDPFDDTSNAIAADAFGVQSSVQISPNVYLGGWAGLTRAQAMDLPGTPTANIFNWAATLSFVDIGGKDSLAGIIIGQPPKVTHNQFTANGASFSDPDTSLHIEAFYRIPITENIATTLGVLVITNPDHNAANGTTYVGGILTLIEF